MVRGEKKRAKGDEKATATNTTITHLSGKLGSGGGREGRAIGRRSAMVRIGKVTAGPIYPCAGAGSESERESLEEGLELEESGCALGLVWVWFEGRSNNPGGTCIGKRKLGEGRRGGDWLELERGGGDGAVGVGF
jgi:hypothetical protein